MTAQFKITQKEYASGNILNTEIVDTFELERAKCIADLKYHVGGLLFDKVSDGMTVETSSASTTQVVYRCKKKDANDPFGPFTLIIVESNIT